MPQRWQRVAGGGGRQAVVEQRGERGDRSGIDELFGRDGVRFPALHYMSLPPVTSSTVPVI